MKDRRPTGSRSLAFLTPAALRQRGVERNVVLGWAHDRSARYALEVAGAEAAARGARLTVVTAPAPEDEDVRGAQGRPFDESGLLAGIAEVGRRHPSLVIDLLRGEESAVETLTRPHEGRTCWWSAATTAHSGGAADRALWPVC